jgi:hypothetical protein
VDEGAAEELTIKQRIVRHLHEQHGWRYDFAGWSFTELFRLDMAEDEAARYDARRARRGPARPDR